MYQVWEDSYGTGSNPLPDNQRNEAAFMVLRTINGREIERIPPGQETSSCKFDYSSATISSNIIAIVHTHPYSDGDDPEGPSFDPGVYDADDVSNGDEAVVEFVRYAHLQYCAK